MPHLTLHPWELPPNCTLPVFAPADFQIEGVAFRFAELLPGQFFLFISDGAENLIVLTPRTGEPRIWSRNERERAAQEFAAVKAEPREWRSQAGRLARLFILEDGAVCINEGFLIAWLGVEFTGRTEFRLPEKREREEDIRGELLALLQGPATEAAFALKWSKLDFEGRQAAVFFSHEARAELHQLMRWMLQSCDEIWNGEPYWMWKCDESVKGQHTLQSPSGERALGPEFPNLYRWSQLLDEHILPLSDAIFAAQFLCTRGHHQISRWVQITKPTVEERAEALLRLGEWQLSKLTGTAGVPPASESQRDSNEDKMQKKH